ncbi:CaiB/BaiF CoA-transferase family protein [Acuticoccus sp. I52.16.1]|uniref:CaiB/BaiF CoA transferase family protein n=1 Tax=Acuticoccus sp. I52.16.1 TaxID=2928472 RepID=UPI001FD445FB|nr:CoA transferase [Acuticoccus sp. I52.16.1]UOM34029.1 CoA transferase [Acuticoccus sp. I52.16.1]
MKPLHGIRVVEISHMIMGPSCGMYLALMGAEVIKIEPPQGDKTRDLTGMGAGFFPTFNRGKKSVTLDLKSEDGLKRLHDLLATADVFVENFRDETIESMGLTPDELHALYPRLVTASCKGFLEGPYKTRTALDEVVQMMTGMAYMTGPTGRPLRIGSSATDLMAGLASAYAVMGELMQRERTGKGADIRTGLFETSLLMVCQHMVQFDLEGVEAPPMPERHFSWPVYDIFTTADDRQIFVGSVTEGQWAKLCTILGLSDYLTDPELKTRPQQIAQRHRTIPVIAEAIARQRSDPLEAALEAAGLPYSPILRPAEMYDDPHVNRPGGLFVSNETGGKSFRAPTLPFEVDGVPPVADTMDLPAIGEHNEEILGALAQTAER